MKKAILFLFLMLASTLFINAQNAIAKLKFEEAEEAYSISNFELTLSKLKEVEAILKSANPKVLHLKISAEGQLTQTINYQDDPELISQLKRDCDFYLTKYESIPDNEDKYREVYKVSETHESPAYLAVYKKAQSGNIKAQVEMGDFYYNKKGLEKPKPGDPDPRMHEVRTRIESAIVWYEKAAIQGDLDAMYQLGIIHQYQKIDLEKSNKWLEMAANKGSIKCMLALGDINFYTLMNVDKGIYWYKKAADLKSIKGMQSLGNSYANKKTSIEWYLKAMQIEPKTELDTLSLAGIYSTIVSILYFGMTVEKNYAKVEEYANQGMPFAIKAGSDKYFLTFLGDIYKTGGHGITQDYAKAFAYYTASAKIGESASMLLGMAEMYQEGLGIKKNKQTALELSNKAIKILKESSNGENWAVMYRFVEAYERGIGVSKDLALANEWKMKAEATVRKGKKVE